MDNIIPGFSGSEEIIVLNESDLLKAKFPRHILKEDADAEIVSVVLEKYKLGDRQERLSKLNQFLYSLINCYSQLPDVTYVRRTGNEGDKGTNEGTLTRQSVRALQGINEALQIYNVEGVEERSLVKQELLCKLLSVNGEYSDGATILFDKTSIKEVRAMFNIPESGLHADEIRQRLQPFYQGSGKRPDAASFYTAYEIIAKDNALIARLLNNCFDFKFSSEDNDNVGMRSHESRRNRDKSSPEKLFLLASRHLTMCFCTYPTMIEAIDIDSIISEFSALIYEQQDWKSATDDDEDQSLLSLSTIIKEITFLINQRTLTEKKITDVAVSKLIDTSPADFSK